MKNFKKGVFIILALFFYIPIFRVTWNPHYYPMEYYDAAYHSAQVKNILENNFHFPYKEPEHFLVETISIHRYFII